MSCSSGRIVYGEGAVGATARSSSAWLDIDGNGLQDVGEPGLAGVAFLLRNGGTGSLVAVAISDVLGTYVFSGIPSGEYYVEVVPPAGRSVTASDVGDDDAQDSDFDGKSLASPLFILVDCRLDIDCGFTKGKGF